MGDAEPDTDGAPAPGKLFALKHGDTFVVADSSATSRATAMACSTTTPVSSRGSG